MKSIDALLADSDGLKWFNRMYLMVTDQVNANPPGGAWQNPAWLEHLDVVFAQFYFTALLDSLAGRNVASSWTALFEARFKTGIDRIQFAVAGMNAHINHDLAQALVRTNIDLNVVPAPDGTEHRDYQSVNVLLNSLMPSILNMLATDVLGLIAQDTGKIRTDSRVLEYLPGARSCLGFRRAPSRPQRDRLRHSADHAGLADRRIGARDSGA